jgi:hypothetical protein
VTHLKPRSATKVLYQGDDMSRLAELDRAVKRAERQSSESAPRMGDSFEAAVTAAQREYDAFVDEAAARAVEVVVCSIGRRRFAELVDAYPPREIDSEPDDKGETHKVEHPDDNGYGVNTATFPRALLTFRDGDYVTLTEPKFGSQREVEDFIDDELAEGDYEELWVIAYMLNRGPSGDPLALRSAVSMSGSPSTDET